MKKYLVLAAAVAVSLASLNGCKECELQAYEGGNRICFWSHKTAQSLFGATEAQMPYDTIKLDLYIMGFTADYDRVVTGAAQEDPAGTEADKKLTTATPEMYQILGGTIPAGELAGKFKVVVNNKDAYLGNGETQKLRVILTESKDFLPGLMENEYHNLQWSRAILQPSTWNAMRFFFCSQYSTTVYRIIMETCGIREFWYYQADPETGIQLSQWDGWVYGRKFGDYVREYNLNHPGAPLVHEDGTYKGQVITPIN